MIIENFHIKRFSVIPKWASLLIKHHKLLYIEDNKTVAVGLYEFSKNFLDNKYFYLQSMEWYWKTNRATFTIRYQFAFH